MGLNSDKTSKVFCINTVKHREQMQIQAKTGGILYDRGRKPGSNHPDLELGKEF